MSSFRLVPVCILLFFSFDVGANAATTNVNAVIAARLAKKGIFHHTHDVYRRRPCVLCGDPRPITDRIRLRASNIRLSSTGGAIFGDAMFVDDPNPRDITYWVQYDDNCNPAGLKNSMTMILSKQIARMTTVTITDQIAIQGGATIGASGGVLGLITLSGSINFSATGTHISARSSSETQTDIVQASYMQEVGPMTRELGRAWMRPTIVTIPFSITVIADGDISPNDEGKQRLSDVLTVEERTFTSKGKFTIFKASDIQAKFIPAATLNAADCKQNGFSADTTSIIQPGLLCKRGGC
jgi:hypothetical protein